MQAFPNGGATRQISDDGGTFPAWSRNGHDLFFWQFDEHRPQSQLMAASYQARGESFVADKPRAWSERRLVSFLLNFFDELHRRVPLSSK